MPDGDMGAMVADALWGSRYRAMRYVQGRHHVVDTAITLGLEQVDEFVHASGTGPQPNRDQQYHSRRAHSFLCVFKKPRGRTIHNPEAVA